jgi:hypothetical protein
MKGVLIFCCILICTACQKKETIPPTPPPAEPKPTIQITATPSATVEHGDSVMVSCAATNALTVPPVVKFRPLKDTMIYRTVSGLGGQITDSLKITVTIPQDAQYLTSAPWKMDSLRLQKADGTWVIYSLNHCDSVNRRKFSLDFRETNTTPDISCGVPGTAADWYWKSGPAGKRDSLYWGSPVYKVYQLNTNKLVLRQMVRDLLQPTLMYLVEWTYIH